ncbi:VOC family protein [Amycolatopsis jejuensis]|uniref:VOC family protein n=1 Tax=Amycolatopsis jejuensis TaxID=330084 RepID=UPI000526BF19|nr:VOC family protein [Amycolatopsis jejuensis]
MSASVRSLGYAIVAAPDLTAWKEFAADLLGLQVAESSADRLLLRMDEKAYRLDIRKADHGGVTAIGWETAGPAELDEIAARLDAAGYPVTREDPKLAQERQVAALVSVEDPDGQRIELYYGAQNDKTPFASPIGARFVTGTGGFGHGFQMVNDPEAYQRFYFELLGFRLSDTIAMGPVELTFAHCNPRHHSFAWGSVPNAPRGVAHLMFEVDDIDFVGRAWDRVQAGAAPVAWTFGRHSNDKMISFYAVSPSGFQVEYGYGGLLIDDATWTPSRHDVASHWGHVPTDPNDV